MSSILFWSGVTITLVGFAMFCLAILQRAWVRMTINLFSIAIGLGIAVFWWHREGSCLLPHSSTIEYHRGMTLCPGQSTVVTVTIPEN